MKVKKGLMLRKVGDDYVIVATGEAAKAFNGAITLNEVCAFIWKQLEKGKDLDEIAVAMTEEYDVDKQTAAKDAQGFITALKEAGLVE